MKEFDLIHRYILSGGYIRKDVVLGIGDDAAITRVPEGQRLVVTTDTLVEGVHFLANTPASAVAHKMLAVNLSDLAAMGAEPAWVNLSLSLPRHLDESWVESFFSTLNSLTHYYGVQLIGGDTVAGALSVTVTAMGFTPEKIALTRSGAKPGDWLYVSGTLGDAGAGLQLLMRELTATPEDYEFLTHRHYCPTPQVALGTALRRLATACIDISDGLLADLSHLLQASEVGASVQVDRLPLSAALKRSLPMPQALTMAMTAGDDYELLFTVAEEQKGSLETLLSSTNVPVTCIGQLNGVSGKLELKHFNNSYPLPSSLGYEHRF